MHAVRSTDARGQTALGATAEEKEEGKQGELVEWTPGHVPLIEDYRSVMLQRAVFQSVASMGLPAFTIHSIVRYSGRALKDAKNTRIRTWGPIGVSLAFFHFPFPSLFSLIFSHLLFFLHYVDNGGTDDLHSSASSPSPSSPSSSINRSKRQSNGVSIRASKRSGARKLSLIDLLLVE